MVTVFLRGGLGNQMFQYALGLHLAMLNRAPLLLDTVFLQDRLPRRNFTYRTFDLDIFRLEPRYTALSKIARELPIPGVYLGVDLGLQKAREFFGIRKIVREKSDAFDAAALRARGSLLLFGRWQNEKYFADITDAVRAAFQFRIPLRGDASLLAEQIGKCNSVSLHVRRGDYATFRSVEAMMGKTNLAYYSRAADYVAARVKEPRFFVFSDDIEWCKENMKNDFPTTYVPSSAAGPKASHHLELMSLCRHNIITNSTYSWWGAWLNRNPEKIVVAPKRWYADSRNAHCDIVPDGWIKA